MGQDSEPWVCHYVTRTVSSGGKTAAHPTLASLTGMMVGTGVGVSGREQQVQNSLCSPRMEDVGGNG